MKILVCALLSLLLFTQASFAAEAELPQTYDKQRVLYFLIRHIAFDVDEILEEMGMKVYACRLENSGKAINYRGVGPCLYDSMNYTFKEKKSSTVWVWVLNDQNQYLPPLKIEWKHSHSGFFKFISEFLFLTFEESYSKRVKDIQNVLPISQDKKCKVASLPNQDLGNFIGDLVITIPKGRHISEYLKFDALKRIDTQKLSINAKVPFYLNKKRAYQVSANYQNPQQETLSVSILTDFNMVTPRKFCLSGNVDIIRPANPGTAVVP
jgi:hypothetical protein